MKTLSIFIEDDIVEVKTINCWYCEGTGCNACKSTGHVIVKIVRKIGGRNAPRYIKPNGIEIGLGHRKYGRNALTSDNL